MTSKQLLTVEDASEVLSLGLSTVYAHIASGALKAVFFPPTKKSKATKQNKRCIRIKVEDVHRFIDNYYTGGLSSSNEEVV